MRHAVYGLVAMLGACSDGCVPDFISCPYDSQGLARRPNVSVRDKQGNLVPMQRVELTRDLDTSECPIHPDGVALCYVSGGGAVQLSVEVGGMTLTREHEVTLTELHSCDPEQDVRFRLPGDGCPRPRGVAIEGRLIDATGAEVSGSVEAEVFGQRRVCVSEGARFRCPSMTPYTAVYTLRAFLPARVRAERRVVVVAIDCSVKIEDGSIDARSGDVTLHVD